MRLTLMAAFVVAFGTAPANAQGQPQDSVKVGVFGYRSDGSVNVSAWDRLPSANALVFTSGGCRVGAGYPEPPDEATDAWRFSGNVLSADAEAAVVQLTWQRVLDHGSAAATESSVELRIPRGEKVVLDHVAAPASPGCAATAILFEAHYGSRPMATVVRPDIAARSRRDRAVGEGLRPYTMNLWLVRTAPGQPEEVLARPVVVITKEAVVAFAPLTLDAPGGPVVVRLTGSFEVTKGNSGEELLFVAGRTITPASGSPRDRAAQIRGTSKVTTPMPGPEEVLSFEMPPIRLQGGTELPDRFSVRLQIRGH